MNTTGNGDDTTGANAAPADRGGDLIAGRYRRVRRLGAGGMSVVELAEDTVLKRTVAIKLIAEHLAHDQDFVTRFRHEALAVARLQHPNIVQVFDSGLDDSSGRQYIVMEYVEGTPLSDLIGNGRRLDPERAVRIAMDACDALDCAHQAGVVHRDVKPANLIVTPDGHAKLMDFGIAKAAEMTRVTQAGSVLGTVAYLSPEQAVGGDTGPRSDIYSLAVVAYEMLAGRPPYEYRSITELAMKQRDQTPQPIAALNPEVPVELDRTIRVALSHDAASRFADAREFAAALRSGMKRRETEFVTAVLSDPEAATRLIQARRAPAAPATGKTAKPAAPAVPTEATPATATPGKSGFKRFAAVAMLLLAITAAAAGGFLLGDSGTAPVIEQTVQDQIEAMRGFILEHR